VFADDLRDGAMLVLERAGRVVGAAALNDKQELEYHDLAWSFTEGRVGVVHRLMVDPSMRRIGLGKKLMGAVEEWARRRGFNALRLDAFSGNPGALQLYRSMGYREAGPVRFRKGLFLCFERRLDNRALQRTALARRR
jgi:GNAT superfamily N-acetyltransferase